MGTRVIERIVVSGRTRGRWWAELRQSKSDANGELVDVFR